MKRKLFALTLALLTALTLFSTTARADMGPKPSIHITFEGMGHSPCYGTLLSERESTGPSSTWDGIESHIDTGGLPREICQAFADYSDPGGYFFLQEGWLCSGTGSLDWTYYPPSPFKILLYYPDSGTFAVSGVYERYAFDSYFTVRMEGAEIGSVELTAVKSYDYTWELISLVCRIAATILLELGMALLFGLGRRELLHLIIGVNLVTQIVLNVLLNVVSYQFGSMAFVLFYVLLEIVVFLLEAAVYAARLPMLGTLYGGAVSRSRCVLYALAANAVSFLAGFWIARALPGIF